MNDRRHELDQNDLALQLNRASKTVEPYTKIIAAVAIAGIIGGIAWAVVSNQAVETRSDSTLELIQATGSSDPEKLANVASLYPETEAARWAKLYQGNEYLGQGIEALYNDRGTAEQLFEDARASIQSALAGSSDQLLQSRAHLSLGRIDESLGEIDAAVEHYRQVITVGESEAMRSLAQGRIDNLSTDDAKSFIDWFGQQEFAPPEPSLPPALPSSDALPDLPDMSLPDLGDDMPSNAVDGDAGDEDDMPTAEPTQSPDAEAATTEPMNDDSAAGGEEAIDEEAADEQTGNEATP